jgi:antagonist of KipI
MSIRIIKAGILDSFQDTGRYGYGKWGINPSGAMDRYAAQAANALVGNPLTEGVIEMHFPASEFILECDALISITGADFSALLNAKPIPLWKAIFVKRNSVLTFKHKIKGSRCYLAVHGGFDLKPWLQSVSTNLKIQAGGLYGTSLKKNDAISFRPGTYLFPLLQEDVLVLPWSMNVQAVYNDPCTFFFIEGKEWNWLTPASQQRMSSEQFRIDPSSDRMASQLLHTPFEFCSREELLSSAVSFGTLQALPSGNLLALMADHQVTGGYPRIGHIISAHLPKLAQLSPLENFQLQKISVAEAEKMLLSLHWDLQVQQRACLKKLDHLLCSV